MEKKQLDINIESGISSAEENPKTTVAMTNDDGAIKTTSPVGSSNRIIDAINSIDLKEIDEEPETTEEIKPIVPSMMVAKFSYMFSREAVQHLVNYFGSNPRHQCYKIHDPNLKMLVMYGLDLYCKYIAVNNIKGSMLYGGIVDWIYYGEKPANLFEKIMTRDIDILTTNNNDFRLGFKYFIENEFGVPGCANVIWRKMSHGITISVFGVKLFDITPTSKEMINSSIIGAIWNGVYVFVPNYDVILSQKFFYFQSCNHNYSQLRFHMSDQFINKGIRGFNMYVHPNRVFMENEYPPIKMLEKSTSIVDPTSLARKIDKMYNCRIDKNELVLIGEEAALLIARRARKIGLCTDEEYGIFEKSVGIGVGVNNDKVHLNYKEDHRLWVCVSKFSKDLNITDVPFAFAGPVTLKDFKIKTVSVKMGLMGGLGCSFKSVKFADNLYTPNIFALFTILTARMNIRFEQCVGSCLNFLKLLLSRIRAKNIETTLTGDDKFIGGFYSERLCYEDTSAPKKQYERSSSSSSGGSRPRQRNDSATSNNSDKIPIIAPIIKGSDTTDGVVTTPKALPQPPITATPNTLPITKPPNPPKSTSSGDAPKTSKTFPLSRQKQSGTSHIRQHYQRVKYAKQLQSSQMQKEKTGLPISATKR